MNEQNNIRGFIVSFLATFLVSVSMGLNAVIFPVTLELLGMDISDIGLLLSIEIVASLLVCIYLTRILSFLNMQLGFSLSAFFRVVSLLILVIYKDNILLWIILIFFHGIGSFFYLIMLQTIVNAIPVNKFKGLMIGLFGTSVSIGVATGPIILNCFPMMGDELVSLGNYYNLELLANYVYEEGKIHNIAYFASAIFSFLAYFPSLFYGKSLPKIKAKKNNNIIDIIKQIPTPMFAILLAGISYYGVTSFIVIYGLKNGLNLIDSSFLLTAFMLGSLFLETPLSFVSDFFDRRYVIMVSVLASLLCSVFLPIVIYVNYQAWLLVFFWGGLIGAIYSVVLTMVGEHFDDKDLITACAGYSFMEAIGGIIGVILIGFSIEFFDTDGLPYIIMLAGVVYFSYALTRYRVV